ncbi:hypothetical protein GUITHDRAFT_77450, partial [Guillardia theta CCMP2712]
MEDLEEAGVFVREGGAKEALNGQKPFTTHELLCFYGWYKQAMQGDVQGTQPGMLQVEARAKWKAWERMKGKDREWCAREYIKKLEERIPEWRSWPKLEAYR